MRSMQWQLGMLGTISALAYRQRETKKNLCRGGRSQDLPNTDFQPVVRQSLVQIVVTVPTELSWLQDISYNDGQSVVILRSYKTFCHTVVKQQCGTVVYIPATTY